MQTSINDALINKYVTPVFRVSGNEPDAFISRIIAPRVQSEGKAFAYREGADLHTRVIDSRVGARGKAARLDTDMSWTDDSVERHFGGSFIPDELVRVLNTQGVDRGGILSNEASDNMETFAIEEENGLADYMTTQSNFTNTLDLSTTTKWSASNGDMQKDILAKHPTVKAGTKGRRARLLVLTEQAYMNALTALRSQNDFGELPTDEILARLFRVDRVVLGSAIYNSAQEGATASYAELWEANDASSGAAWLIYTSGTAGRTGKGFANTFVWPSEGGQDVLVDQDIMKNPKGVDLLYEQYYKMKVQNELAVYMWYNCV